ncbi:metallophosphoesterase family protein [Clostridium sp. 19966]|uniref:metallophosphoesterase family protein n=1 Tax=Clostridium sp. 19966 TaxID=2768166 RepID=UPI0028DE876D|nr:metallophosphoesterase family protein [Clostridium sp. 19966]MDT8719747.1 metallophosphoesterase family protein [Clostridium sp. 19966]
MDKIALISDIHANIPALEAVLSDIKKRNIKRIMCLGDLAGKGASPELAVDIIKNNCECVIKGNWDYLIAEVNDGDFLQWNNSRLRKDQLEYLAQLPLYRDFYMSGRLIRLCHAAPSDVFGRVRFTASVEEKLSLFVPPDNKSKECDVLVYGDIHVAYIQNFNEKTIINVGSVGVPLRTTDATYSIIEGEYGSAISTSLSMSIIRVPYDKEKAIEEAQAANVPNLEKFIYELRTGEVFDK